MSPELTGRGALNIVWFDLEFTTVELERAHIMQAAALITNADLTPLPEPATGMTGFCVDVRLDAEQAATASEWVRANQSEQLTRSQESEDAVALEDLDQRLFDYVTGVSKVQSTTRADNRNPLLAGNSIHNDYHLVRNQLPRFSATLSYRLLDVSTIKELVRRWHPTLEFDKRYSAEDYLPAGLELEGEEHDAAFDVKCSIAELNYYRQKLWSTEP